MNNLIRLTNERRTEYMACPVETTDAIASRHKELAAHHGVDINIEVFTVGKMPLDKLPEDIQAQVRSTLKAYSRCNVTFEHGTFRESVNSCIKASYGYDHFVCGEYKADEVYTLEERRRNYAESFGCAAHF